MTRVGSIDNLIYNAPLIVIRENFITGKVFSKAVGYAVCSTEPTLRSSGKLVFSSDTILGLIYKTKSGRIKLLDMSIFDDLTEKPLEMQVHSLYNQGKKSKCRHHSILNVVIRHNDYWASLQ